MCAFQCNEEEFVVIEIKMNRWKIPSWLEREIIARDHSCVYCGNPFIHGSSARRSRPSWEHIINNARIISKENIALSCIGCNASKGSKDLTEWLKSTYCIEHGITEVTVAEVVKAHLQKSTGTDV